MIEAFEKLVTNIDPFPAYLLLFASAFVENTFPPIPGDTVTVFGAYLVSIGKLSFWGVYLTTTAGSVLGFFTMYLIGRWLGPGFIYKGHRARIFGEQRFEKVKNWFANYGYWVILANRFLSGTRSVISLFAGFFHLKWGYVLMLSIISALLWNGALIYGGYLLGVNWKTIGTIIREYNTVVLILTAIALGTFLWLYLNKKRKFKSQG